jgi:hypothetical protein
MPEPASAKGNGEAAGERRVFGAGDGLAAGRQSHCEQKRDGGKAVVAVGIARNNPDRHQHDERNDCGPRSPMRPSNRGGCSQMSCAPQACGQEQHAERDADVRHGSRKRINGEAVYNHAAASELEHERTAQRRSRETQGSRRAGTVEQRESA